MMSGGMLIGDMSLYVGMTTWFSMIRFWRIWNDCPPLLGSHGSVGKISMPCWVMLGSSPQCHSKDKSLQCSNWDQRPLSPEQICCSAATDCRGAMCFRSSTSWFLTADGVEVLLLNSSSHIFYGKRAVWQEKAGTGKCLTWFSSIVKIISPLPMIILQPAENVPICIKNREQNSRPGEKEGTV